MAWTLVEQQHQVTQLMLLEVILWLLQTVQIVAVPQVQLKLQLIALLQLPL